MRFVLAVLFISFLITSIPTGAARADDSDIFPNRLHASPPPSTPTVKPTAVPAPKEHPGNSLSPENGSAMGLGFQIPLGSRKVDKPRKKKKRAQEPEDGESTVKPQSRQ